MASIRKSFSFRNGVQVDEDNFIVNANGLVGIGTSVPSEFLDVRGTAKVVGLVTAADVFVSGVATITDIKVGSAISITDGGVAATRFYGDGATLSNLPTSQWKDVNVRSGLEVFKYTLLKQIKQINPQSFKQLRPNTLRFRFCAYINFV